MMKKQICMIAYTNYKSDARVRREAETLAATGEFEIWFLVLREEDTPKFYEIEGVNVIELNVRKYRGQNKFKHFISYMQFFFLAFCMCSKLLFTCKLDAVHVHNMPNFLVFAGILPRLFGKKVILDIHDPTPEMYYARYDDNPNRFLFNFLCREEALACGFANMIICATHVLRDKLVGRRISSQKIAVSMNVPDPRWFRAPAAVKDNVPDNIIKLVYHGTLAKRLGIDLMIRAFAKLYQENPAIEFYIFGNGEGLAEYIALSKDLGLDKSIFFSAKMIPLESLFGVLQDMNIGIVANRRNSATELMLPVKLLEYIALGIPVVAPELKAIKHYLTDEMVCYFEPGNVHSLIQAISDLCKDETKRKLHAEKAKAFLDQYGWEKHGMDLIKLYRKI